MAARNWTLLDVDRGVVVEQLRLTAGDVSGVPPKSSVWARRLVGGLRDGVEVIEIDNGVCRFTVVPTRGMSIHRAWLGDLEIGWRSPVRGPVHPKFVGLWAPHGIGWLDGFDELLVRCGLESNGPPVFDEQGRLKHPLHGRIANQPAHRVELAIDAQAGEITLRGEVEESRLFHNKLRLTTTIRTKFGEPGFRVHDEIQNLSTQPAELQLLYHINLGQPLLTPGAKVAVPLKTLVPQTAHAAAGLSWWDSYREAEPGFAEHVFHTEPAADADGHTQVLLRGKDGGQGVGVRFNIRQLPLFTLWKSLQPAADGYVTGLEPSINYPNPRAFEKENGRVATLRPGESRTFDVALEIYPDPASVAAADAAIGRLQAGTKPTIYQQPKRPWCAAGK
jgi:galactose mutarotase-like enzyme